jgi:dihydropteroate synthase
MILRARDRVLAFPRPPLVMGIVNLCPDSFSGDGLADPHAALAQAREFMALGAEIIDIGAESARTNRAAISESEEIGRLRDFLELWREIESPPLLSINTWRPAVARAVLTHGGDLLNDIGGLPDEQNARICAETGAALLIMHTEGEPKVPHTHVQHREIMETLRCYFERKLALAEAAGLPRERTILDPGIDFAKQAPDNLRIYRHFGELHQFGRPILLPISRKTVIGEVLGLSEPRDRDPGTVACLVQGYLQGARLFRVHNVRAAVQSLAILRAVSAAPESLAPPDIASRLPP